MLSLRMQNDRDRFYVHIDNDDYHIVKSKKFAISFVGAAVIIRRTPTGVAFRARHGNDISYDRQYRHALMSESTHPFFPLFGPYECKGEFDAAGNMFTTLPNILELPWPSSMATKYTYDDDSCDWLLGDRVKALRAMGKNILEIPEHMVCILGFERLKNLILKNPWLQVERATG